MLAGSIGGSSRRSQFVIPGHNQKCSVEHVAAVFCNGMSRGHNQGMPGCRRKDLVTGLRCSEVSFRLAFPVPNPKAIPSALVIFPARLRKFDVGEMEQVGQSNSVKPAVFRHACMSRSLRRCHSREQYLPNHYSHSQRNVREENAIVDLPAYHTCPIIPCLGITA